MSSTKLYYKDWTTAADTTGGSGSPPFAGLTGTTGAGTGFSDLGNASAQSVYYVSSGALKNDYLNRNPGTFLFDSINNGCIRTVTEEKFQDGQVWIQHNGSLHLGALARCDATGASDYGIGGMIENGTFYIIIKTANGSTVPVQSQAVGISTPSDAWCRLKVTNTGGNNITIRVSQYSALAFDPSGSGEPEDATESAYFEYVYDATNNTAVLASGAAGVFSYNTGSVKAFASYVVSSALDIAAPSVVFRGSECITVSVNAATGGAGTKTYNLGRRVSGGSWGTLAAGVSTGSYDDTTVVPGTTYEYRVTVTDDTTSVTSPATEARALLTTEPCIVVTGDSNLDPTFGTATPRAHEALVQWLAGLNVDSTAKSFAIAGTTSVQWTPTGLQSGTLASAVTFGNKYGATHYIRVLGTNDAKTAVSTTQSAYNTAAADFETYVFANATTSPKILHGTPAFINGASAGSDWDSGSDARIETYITALQARETGNVYLMDNPARVVSWHDAGQASPASYGLTDDVHYPGAGHYRQALAWEQGYWGPIYRGSGSGGGTEVAFIATPMEISWAGKHCGCSAIELRAGDNVPKRLHLTDANGAPFSVASGDLSASFVQSGEALVEDLTITTITADEGFINVGLDTRTGLTGVTSCDLVIEWTDGTTVLIFKAPVRIN